MWNFIIGEWTISPDSTEGISYFGKSIQLFNTHFHWDELISLDVPVIELVAKKRKN